MFTEGYFTSLSVNDLEVTATTRELLTHNKAALALLEYASLKDDAGNSIAPDLEKEIKKNASNIDCEKVFKDMFYNISYTDYLFSLPMGAGKTFLMAAFIYLDLYFGINEPSNKAFAKNFIVFAPSGLKSSVVPSLKDIKNFDPSWVLPKPVASEIKKILKFEVLDEQKSKSKSNRAKNPNAQKINLHQPIEDLIGLVAVTNAEKVILNRVEVDVNSLFDKKELEQCTQANELRALIGKIPDLAVYIDEVHHAVDEEILLRKVVTGWTEQHTFNSVIGFSGTPYLERAESVQIGSSVKLRNSEITNVVYYYPLIKGINNFLKSPIVKTTTNNNSLEIVKSGVLDFFENYGTKRYENGCLAKLGIYCGSIDNLENHIHPLVVQAVTDLGYDPNEIILKYHRGNKDFKVTSEAEAEFQSLDSSISKKRVVLLVQIGKEGWNCKSLTGIILSQKGDCPTNMVLQTSCRCLRQVDRGKKETALIWLNSFNEEKLDAQLKQQHNISLQEFKTSSGNQPTETIKLFSRVEHLKLPAVDFYQLKVEYNTLITENASDVHSKISQSTQDAVVSDIITTKRAFNDNNSEIERESKGIGNVISFNQWVYEICRESFGTLPMNALEQYSKELKRVYDAIMIDDRENLSYNHSTIRSNIRKAFSALRSIQTTEEIVPAMAKLLRIENLATTKEVAIPNKYYPEQKKVEAIISADNGVLSSIDAETQKAIDSLESIGQKEMADKLRAEKSVDVSEKDKTYHYLPYRFDSNFEILFFTEILKIRDFNSKGLEIYYNGDRGLTDFKIRCYKQRGKSWLSVGHYTPDFLIIKRIDGKIHQAIIVETKGLGYAGDRNFIEKKTFMETFFCKENNSKFGYNRFDYLYLEDSLSEQDRINKTIDSITTFFK